MMSSSRTATEPLWRRKLQRGARFISEYGFREVWRRARCLGLRGCLDYAIINLRFVRGDAVNRWFDFVHHVDTSGHIASEDLDVIGDHKSAGADFMSTPARTLRRALDALPQNLSQFTFVDIGCGKGRALLVAAGRNFRRAVGIEHAPALVAITERNIGAWRGARRCRDLRVICTDATTFELPIEPCVIYFFGPFADKVVLARVLENIAASLRAQPRPIYVLYLDAIEQAPPDASMIAAGFRPVPCPDGGRLFDPGVMRCPVFYAVYLSVTAECSARVNSAAV